MLDIISPLLVAPPLVLSPVEAPTPAPAVGGGGGAGGGRRRDRRRDRDHPVVSAILRDDEDLLLLLAQE